MYLFTRLSYTELDFLNIHGAQESIPKNQFRQPTGYVVWARILEQSIGGLGIERNRVVVPARQATQAGGMIP